MAPRAAHFVNFHCAVRPCKRVCTIFFDLTTFVAAGAIFLVAEFHRVQAGEVGGGLIAGTEWRDITLQRAVQRQAKSTGDDEVGAGVALAALPQSGIEVIGEKNSLGKNRPQGP